MSDTHQHAVSTLRDVDAGFHRLLEAVAADEAAGSVSDSDPIATLRRARSQIDAALFAHQHRTADNTLPESGSCVLQWDPGSTPPRRLVLDPDSDGTSWTQREFEWNGSGWRVCRRTSVSDVAISAAVAPHYPSPVDPLTVDALVTRIRGSWMNPDPDVLVFTATATTERGVVAAVADELRYRELDSTRWFRVTTNELQHHLQQQGQPALQSLSETPLTRQHFTQSPLSQ
ncbi:hypothetical protein C464_16277 [Halorubrum coriense DSM 10284]|uniref:Uncharacterized protein n=1 Tax=Halorubrum coriense DSM 10284 TaxID=1227466 RepID=M0E9I3_9EURY|nr:hypothetical protein [Halorubrum coriense]ELZ43723.1 hypothetical protein C464_16277 [Halorubrum coriense DSM 10284]